MGTFQLYLIRHAQSANNALPESERVEDPGITDLGHRQAAHLAERLRSVGFTHFQTSGFRRALETSQPVATHLTVEPEVRIRIHEVGGCYRGYRAGQLEGRPGMNREAIADEFPDFRLPDELGSDGWWQSRPYEDFTQARQRAADQAKVLLDTYSGTAAVVGWLIHADFKDLLLDQLMGEHYAALGPADLHNTGVTVLEFSQAAPRIVLFNDVSHLPAELISS